MDVCIIDLAEPYDVLTTTHEAFVTFNKTLWTVCGILAVVSYVNMIHGLVVFV